VRGDAGRCLAPCSGDPAIRTEHDALVAGIVEWLAGAADAAIPDPQERVDDLTRALSKQRRYEEAQVVRDAWDDVVSIRRSYASLVEAHTLRFASVWPLQNSADSGLRMNVVWNGRLLHQASLRRDSLLEGIDAALAAIDEPEERSPRPDGAPALVAVPQQELDMLLAVRRWFMEAPGEATVVLNGDGTQRHRLQLWREQLLSEALKVLC
jgi:hypothetical protein